MFPNTDFDGSGSHPFTFEATGTGDQVHNVLAVAVGETPLLPLTTIPEPYVSASACKMSCAAVTARVMSLYWW